MATTTKDPRTRMMMKGADWVNGLWAAAATALALGLALMLALALAAVAELEDEMAMELVAED
jgi:hypothetical protein